MHRSEIGEGALGETARSQLEAARRDPRLERGRGAAVADFFAAMEEAERVRMLGVLGLHELRDAFEREQERVRAAGETPVAGGAAPFLQATWERAELARLEIDNEHPHLNAQALLSMNSALDALVEEFVPALRAIRVEWINDQVAKRIEEEQPEAWQTLDQETRERFLEAAREVTLERAGKRFKRLAGSGSSRYEVLLAQEGLGAPADRPIPDDLDQALIEFGALRDVLMHRAGRVDAKALAQAPSLPYEDGQLVRISRADYRRYSAAIRCYAQEILFRSYRSWPEVSDEEDGPTLGHWRDYYALGT